MQCCFCISLRTGTLILGSLSAASAFAAALVLAVSGDSYASAALYLLLGAVAVRGVQGVLQSDPAKLRGFVILNWVEFGFTLFFMTATTIMFAAIPQRDLVNQICSDERYYSPADRERCFTEKEAEVMFSKVFMTFALFVNAIIKVHYCLVLQTYYTQLATGKLQYQEVLNGEDFTTVVAAPPSYVTIEAPVIVEKK